MNKPEFLILNSTLLVYNHTQYSTQCYEVWPPQKKKKKSMNKSLE